MSLARWGSYEYMGAVKSWTVVRVGVKLPLLWFLLCDVATWPVKFTHQIFEPRQAKKCLRTCTKCADSVHPAHAQSNTRPFAVHSCILPYPMILIADSEGPDQTARMRRAIWALCCSHMPENRFLYGTAHLVLKAVLFRIWHRFYVRKRTYGHVYPATAQISLRTRALTRGFAVRSLDRKMP